MITLPSKSFVASLDVDAQYGFTPTCPDELPVPEGEDIVFELNQQAQFAQYRIGSKDAHSLHAVWLTTPENPILSPLKGKHADVHWPAHCIVGTKGFQAIQGLPHPTEYDYYVWKGIESDMHPYGACYHDLEEKLSTGLIEFLKSKKVTTVIVGGLATDYCVKNSVLQLLKVGFMVIVNLGACRGITANTIDEAMLVMHEKGAQFIQSAQELQFNDR